MVPDTLLVVVLVSVDGVPNVTVPEPVIAEKSIPLPADTLVTVPLLLPVPAPMAVLKSEAFNAVTVLSAFTLRKVMADGLDNVNILFPTVVAPKLVRAVDAEVAPVPPYPKPKVPLMFNVPLFVIGPPLKSNPVEPPDAFTLVTVPSPEPAPIIVQAEPL